MLAGDRVQVELPPVRPHARSDRVQVELTAGDPQSSNLSHQVRCSRCQRAPRDDADYVNWQSLDEGVVCPGCLTMLEEEAQRAGD